MSSCYRKDNVRLYLFLIASLIYGGAARADTERKTSFVNPGAADVHRATLGVDDLRRFGYAREIPYFPGFDDNLQRTAAGSLFYVYQRLTSPANSFDSGIRLFSDPSSASSDFLMRKKLDEKEGYLVSTGPALGDETVYLERKRTFGQQAIYSSMIRWRIAGANAYVNYESSSGYLPANRMKKLADRVSQRLGRVLAGKLKAKPMPARLARLMPSESVAAPFGQVLGASVASPLAWGLIDAPDKPAALGNSLMNQGTNRLGYTRYKLGSDPRQVVEVILFPFDSARSANRWLQGPISGSNVPRPDVIPLNVGSTGKDARFVQYNRGGMPMAYELKFAKGKNAADLYCYAPHAATSTACETMTRKLAEGWYASLPK